MDFTIAFFVFLLLWIFLTTQYDTKHTQALDDAQLRDMRVKADIALEYLVKQKGVPANWETLAINDLNQPGLAISDRVLSEAKLAAFSNLSSNYSEMKSKLGLPEYDFYFKFTGIDDAHAGLEPASNASEIIAERIVQYKGGLGIATLKVYRLE